MENSVIREIYSIKDQLSSEAGYSVDVLVQQMKKEIDRSQWNYVSFPPKVSVDRSQKRVVNQ